MQYKIPVQIENEDPIMLGLSLRQLMIIMVGFGIAYGLFKRLEVSLGGSVALLPSIFIIILTLVIALFKNSEMTFVPFVLSFIRYKVNLSERVWKSGVDSFNPIDIGYVFETDAERKDNLDIQEKKDKIKEMDEKLKKI
ncbi:MAG: PrgI family protein [Candidatus Gracilibacteria bacterium]|nr:PrgI family protein [Candidatus Gracilibacteria bacterium]